MSTLTAVLTNNNVKQVHAGLNVATTTYTFCATATASSIFLMVKVPDGATIVDYRFFGNDAAADQLYDIGIVKPEGSTSGSVTISISAIDANLCISGGVTRNVLSAKLPYKVSISGEASPKWAWVTLMNTIAISASALLSLTVFYTMDEA